MKWSNLLIPTLREDPHEAESISHRLLIRAGFIRPVSSGLYSFLPLGVRVLKRIEHIIRQEMNRAGAQEVLLPSLQPGEVWQQSGRWQEMGPELIRFKTRNDRMFVLGPTHEEIITSLVASEIKSYRDLPANFYQIQTKFRDEARPRFGLIRAKEFIMKDAYSFDADAEGLDKSYQAMLETYIRIFERLGLTVEVVEADTGFMGGKSSEEFMAPSPSGEDIMIKCKSCSYRANRERAEIAVLEVEKEKPLVLEEVHTPGVTTIAALEKYLNLNPGKMIKTLIYQADKEVLAILIRGDREINETKLRRLLKGTAVTLAEEKVIEKVTGAPLGFSGPRGLKGLRILADLSIKTISNGLSGANKKDYHLKNINPGRDFMVTDFFDLSYPQPGDRCSRCRGELVLERGVELGHIFKLGTRYSEALGAKFLDKNGGTKLAIMGCYGIGVTRTMASIVEQHYDEDGIIWPEEVAPFAILILPLDLDRREIVEAGEKIYQSLTEKGLNLLLDDRPLRPGIKFKDADLIGIPIRITLGQKFIESGKVEVRFRRDKKTVLLAPQELLSYLSKSA